MSDLPTLGSKPIFIFDAGYTQAFEYDASGNVIYQGWAVPTLANKANAVWRICKFTYDASGNVTDIQWANGNDLFNKVWNDRPSLTYL
jgi:hypothetical protein